MTPHEIDHAAPAETPDQRQSLVERYRLQTWFLGIIAFSMILFLLVHLAAEAPLGDRAEGVVDGGVVLISIAGVHIGGAGCACGGVVGRRIADAVALLLAVAVGAAAFEGMVQAQVVPHFVDEHSGIGGVTAHIAGLQHNTVVGLPVGAGQVGVTGHTAAVVAADLVDDPDIDVL